MDASLDRWLSDILPVGNWNGETPEIQIAVPAKKIYTPKKSRQIAHEPYTFEDFENDVNENGEMYEAFNHWLAEERDKKGFKQSDALTFEDIREFYE